MSGPDLLAETLAYADDLDRWGQLEAARHIRCLVAAVRERDARRALGDNYGSGFDAGMERAADVIERALRGEKRGTPPLGLLDVLDEIQQLRNRAEKAEKRLAQVEALRDLVRQWLEPLNHALAPQEADRDR